MPRALIGLGSNLGERRRMLDEAVAAMFAISGASVIARSAWYESSPIGGPADQPAFLNGAALVETALAPQSLLAELHRIEASLGRTRETVWGPRTIDLDLLLYDDVVLREPGLTLPHPRFSFRKFALRGAVEIAGTMRHPVLQRTLDELLAHLEAAPRYVAFVGQSHGFRSQLAAEAADAARARLVEPTEPGVLPSVELFESHGQTVDSAIEFLGARASAVRRSLADADGAWVVDDAWLVAEALEMLTQLEGDDRFLAEADRILTPDIAPRLIVSLDAEDELQSFRRHGPDLVTLPPVVRVVIADREAALSEIAAALDASA